MNETMPISAGLPAGMTTDACLEAHLRSAFLTGETDGEEAGLRPEFVINDPDRRIKVLTVIEDELARCTRTRAMHELRHQCCLRDDERHRAASAHL